MSQYTEIKILVYPYNLDGIGDQYYIKNLYFKDFFIGLKVDKINYRMIRRFTEGTIMIKNPEDFNTLKPYFDSAQDVQFYFPPDDEWYWGRILFQEPDYTTKRVEFTVNIFDQYSYMFDGYRSASWQLDQVPWVDKKINVFDLATVPDKYFADISLYKYTPTNDLWGFDIETDIETDRVIPTDNILKWNKGGDELTLEDLVAGADRVKNDYIPYWVKYSDRKVISGNTIKFKKVETQWRREYKYFALSEDVPSNWKDSYNEITKNGVTYHKYYRKIDGTDDKWFTGKDNYFIRDESKASTPYMTAEYEGYPDDLKKSNNFFVVKLLCKSLITNHIGQLEAFRFDYTGHLMITSMKNINKEHTAKLFFDLKTFIDFLRDKFGLYFYLTTDSKESGFAYMDWDNTKLLDIDNWKGKDWFLDNKPTQLSIPNEVTVKTDSKHPDFTNQKVSFYGYRDGEKILSETVITDPFNSSESDDIYFLLNYTYTLQDQIYKQLTDNRTIGSEAILSTMNGKFLTWNSDLLDNSTGIWFELSSDLIYTQINDNIYVSFGYVIKRGSVYVSCGDLSWTLTGYGTINTSGHSLGSVTTFTAKVEDLSNNGVEGFLYGIKVKTSTFIPKTETGVITGISQKNGGVSSSYSLKNYKVPMSYARGELVDYGTIYPEVDFNHEIKIRLPLLNSYNIFNDEIFNKYSNHKQKKYRIFERKIQILTPEKWSIIDYLKLRTNEVS